MSSLTTSCDLVHPGMDTSKDSIVVGSCDRMSRFFPTSTGSSGGEASVRVDRSV
jgi:hypothetical protein